MDEVRITERGWAGHYICSEYCKFRRNTLIEYKDKKWVISTIGGYINPKNKHIEPIEHDRFFETMAFNSNTNTEYYDASEQIISFNSPWCICGETWEKVIENYPMPELAANNMHDNVVKELVEKIRYVN